MINYSESTNKIFLKNLIPKTVFTNKQKHWVMFENMIYFQVVFFLLTNIRFIWITIIIVIVTIWRPVNKNWSIIYWFRVAKQIWKYFSSKKKQMDRFGPDLNWNKQIFYWLRTEQTLMLSLYSKNLMRHLI
jgi:hypothetical protein